MSPKYLFMYFFLGGIIVMSIFGMQILPDIAIDQEKTFSVDEVDAIRVKLTTYPLHIIQTGAGEPIKIHLYGKASQEVSLVAAVNQKTVTTEVYYPYPMHGWNNLSMDIYLPADYEKDLSVDITTGKVTLDAMILRHFALQSTTGGVAADAITAESVDVRATTGGIRFKALNSPEIKIKGSTGAITVGTCATQNAVIEGTTGDIRLEQCSGNFNLNTSTGSVSLDIVSFENQNVQIKTTTGKINLRLPASAEFNLQANTTTGSIHSDYPINTVSSHNVSGQVGTGDNKITLKTTTGGISLQKN